MEIALDLDRKEKELMAELGTDTPEYEAFAKVCVLFSRVLQALRLMGTGKVVFLCDLKKAIFLCFFCLWRVLCLGKVVMKSHVLTKFCVFCVACEW